MNDKAELEAQIDALDAAMARNATLLHEVDHRVKNNLQLICSLLVLQSRREADPAVRSALSDILGRVNAVAVVHRRLFQDNPHVFDVAAFLRDLADDRMGDDRVRLIIETERAEAPAASAAPLALTVNELLTNALRHGFPDNGPGKVTLTLSRIDNRLRIGIADDGVGLATDCVDGFGLTIVRLLSGQLKAEFEMSDAAPGVLAVLTLPAGQAS